MASIEEKKLAVLESIARSVDLIARINYQMFMMTTQPMMVVPQEAVQACPCADTPAEVDEAPVVETTEESTQEALADSASEPVSTEGEVQSTEGTEPLAEESTEAQPTADANAAGGKKRGKAK